jgi:type 1 glutamine amidotransferase
VVNNNKIQLILGGTWHNFEGFSSRMTSWLTPAGFVVGARYGLTPFESPDSFDCGTLVLFTCFDAQALDGPTDAQIEALCSWVDAGGGLLAIHSAATTARHSASLKELIGGSFRSHPPKAKFIAEPVLDSHPIVRDLEPFAVEDELYLTDVDSSVRVHLTAQYEGAAQPLVWSRTQGNGKVVYFALGHDESAWDLAAYRKIVAQSIAWLLVR